MERLRPTSKPWPAQGQSAQWIERDFVTTTSSLWPGASTDVLWPSSASRVVWADDHLDADATVAAGEAAPEVVAG